MPRASPSPLPARLGKEPNPPLAFLFRLPPSTALYCHRKKKPAFQTSDSDFPILEVVPQDFAGDRESRCSAAFPIISQEMKLNAFTMSNDTTIATLSPPPLLCTVYFERERTRKIALIVDLPSRKRYWSSCKLEPPPRDNYWTIREANSLEQLFSSRQISL